MALTLLQTKDLLKRLAMYPKRRWGQNFLVNPTFVERSLKWAQIKADDVVVEIGSGCGTLTGDLVQAKTHVFAIEKDPILFEYIRNTWNRVCIICEDAVQYPVGLHNADDANYKIVANLPYAIASVWLDRILELPQLPTRMVLMLQTEAAGRWFSRENSKQFCPLSIFLQSIYRLENKCTVAKRCFYPQPKVDSMLLSLVKNPQVFIFECTCKQFIRSVFVHRRQQIGHVCKALQSIYANALIAFLQENAIDLSCRAECLPIEVWQRFATRCLQADCL
ncbi:MAG: 16S rRNA (adenine(1518)-N(6)/adenine(1519)-N(6))-dimethyltransferase RsmA [Puniceicoccales bacterium]|jgi:16S rRNA (adenine1518-N6/adenine1519-N6)-dimethyltransferase|nr:16S rRNA (adenine(1518)-N(6)/adenine(1519)-N(6))-dimethyltransferase RsmA [Puniceicoccales bacterium]